MDREGASAWPLMPGETARCGEMVAGVKLEPGVPAQRLRDRDAAPGLARGASRSAGREAAEGHPDPVWRRPTRTRIATPG